MIPKPHIAKWQQHAPWKEFAQVEQDLIISRALAEIRTYNINELLGTKFRALYQRSKGRDLFDLDYSRQNIDFDYE